MSTSLGDLPSRLMGWAGKARSSGRGTVEIDLATLERIIAALIDAPLVENRLDERIVHVSGSKPISAETIHHLNGIADAACRAVQVGTSLAAQDEWRCHHCKRVVASAIEPEECAHCKCLAFSRIDPAPRPAAQDGVAEALRPFADLATGDVAGSKEDSTVFILMDGHKRYAAISMRNLRAAKVALSSIELKSDPKEAEDDAVDQQRRDAELEAQRTMTEATIDNGECV